MPDTLPNLYRPVIVRKEIDGSHYYFVDGKFFPGVTTILHETLPTAETLRKWIGDIGNEKAQEKLERAGERGTSIHNACERLLKGDTINLQDEFKSNSDKKCVAAFVNWVHETQPVIKDQADIEKTLASSYGFAGTLDIFCYINDEPWIVDIKTSAGIYEAHKLQQAAYQQAFYEMTGIMPNIGILHLNSKTKKGWSFIQKLEIGGKQVTFDDFMKVFEVYKMLNGGKIKSPPLKDIYPAMITLYENPPEVEIKK